MNNFFQAPAPLLQSVVLPVNERVNFYINNRNALVCELSSYYNALEKTVVKDFLQALYALIYIGLYTPDKLDKQQDAAFQQVCDLSLSLKNPKYFDYIKYYKNPIHHTILLLYKVGIDTAAQYNVQLIDPNLRSVLNDLEGSLSSNYSNQTITAPTNNRVATIYQS